MCIVCPFLFTQEVPEVQWVPPGLGVPHRQKHQALQGDQGAPGVRWGQWVQGDSYRLAVVFVKQWVRIS